MTTAVGFILILNLFLNFGLAPVINAAVSGHLSAEKSPFHIHIGRVISWWPSHFSVRDLKLRAQDSNMQMEIAVGRVEVQVRLSALLHSTFEATRVNGEGTKFTFRQKLSAADANAPDAPKLPRIEGFTDPPLREAKEAPSPPPPVSWMIRIHDVDVGVTDVQIEEYNFVGQARASGAFHLNPILEVGVEGARLAINSGQVRVGADTAFDHLKGDVLCEVSPFNPLKVLGPDVLAVISGRLKIAMDLTDVGFIAPQIKGGTGPLQLDVSVTHGNLDEESLLLGKFTGLNIKSDDYQWMSDLQLTSDEGITHLRFNPISVKHSSKPKFDVHFRQFDLRLTAKKRDLLELASGLEAEGELKPDATQDLRWLNGLLPHSDSIEIQSGAGQMGLSFHWSMASHAAQAVLSAHGLRTRLRVKTTLIQSDWRLKVKLNRLDLRSGKLWLGESHVLLRNLESLSDKSFAKHWWADIALSSGALKPGAKISFEGSVKAKLRDLRPLWLLYESQNPLPPWIPNVLAMEGLEASGNIRVGPSLLELSQIKAAGKNISVGGEVALHDNDAWALTEVKAGLMSAAFELKNKKTEWTLFGPSQWFKDRLERHQHSEHQR